MLCFEMNFSIIQKYALDIQKYVIFMHIFETHDHVQNEQKFIFSEHLMNLIWNAKLMEISHSNFKFCYFQQNLYIYECMNRAGNSF